MIRTPVCDVLETEHPIALGGMGSVYSPELVAAVANAGGFGAMGCHYLNPEQIRAGTAALRERTNKPFALNFLLFDVIEERFAAVLALRPKALAFAWPRPEQDLKPYISRAHDAGCKVTFMANGVPEAVKRPRPAPMSSSRRAPKAAAMSAGWRAWCSRRWWSTPSR
jgi:enoyl-[acyl-carrier protein] reductase II